MVRTIIKPNESRINLSIPDEYIGEEIEILVFPTKDTYNPQGSVSNMDENITRRQKAFERFMKYQGTLPVDFDYKRELAEYRETRYGCTD